MRYLSNNLQLILENVFTAEQRFLLLLHLQRLCLITPIPQALVGEWESAVVVLQSCFQPSSERQLSPASLTQGRCLIRSSYCSDVLAVPVYRDWLHAELVFCTEPQTINYYSRSPMNPLWNKAYCAWTCPFKAPINKLVTASLFLFTAAEWCGAEPVQHHNGNEQQGLTHCSLLFDPSSFEKDLPENLLPFSPMFVSFKNIFFSSRYFSQGNFSSLSFPWCWISFGFINDCWALLL